MALNGTKALLILSHKNGVDVKQFFQGGAAAFDALPNSLCEEILAQRTPRLPRPQSREASILYHRLLAMERGCLAIAGKTHSALLKNDLSMLAPIIDRAVGATESAITNLKQWEKGDVRAERA